MTLMRSLMRSLIRSLMLIAAVTLAAGSVQAGDVTADQIFDALNARAPTRSFSEPATGEDQKFVTTLRNQTTRSLSVRERDEVAAVTAEKPSIDIEIAFDYNSAVLGAAARPSVQALGQALARFNGSTFLLAGHTDGIGGASFNQRLSEQRADAVKRFLVANYGIAAGNLLTIGYGKSRLKYPQEPGAAANRRVQVVNLSAEVSTK